MIDKEQQIRALQRRIAMRRKGRQSISDLTDRLIRLRVLQLKKEMRDERRLAR